MLRTLSAFILIASSLQADIILDQVMSKDDQKKTGVANLTPNQKIALEAWLNKNFVVKQPQATPTGTLFVSINMNNGQRIQLSDNSVWDISPDDAPTAAAWITPVQIQIKPSNNPNYPFLLVDINDGVSVKARKVTAGNPPPSSSP